MRCPFHYFDSQPNYEEYDDVEFTDAPANFFGVYTAVAKFVSWIKTSSDYTGCMKSKMIFFLVLSSRI